MVDLSDMAIGVQAGDQLAFTVRTVDTHGYLYNPESTLGYVGGVGARRNAAVTATWTSTGADFGFRTFVSP